jgi:aminoglycoside phosphotransferase (APT) family kinase protein
LTETEALRDALAVGAGEHFGRAVQIEALEPLLGGSSRELWGFDAVLPGSKRRSLVVRRDPAGIEDPDGRRRELSVLRAAHSEGVPVPEPFWFHSEPGGRAGLVMARLEGEAIGRRLVRDDRYARARAKLTGELAAAAAAVHRIPLDALADLEAPGGHPAESAVEWLERELERVGEPHPALELGLRWLRRHLPAPRAPRLVHGDFRTGNFLVDENGLVAVLDWELCHAGDPAEDLGWLCIRSWRFGADERPAGGFGTREELLAAYAAAGGREVTLEELRFWEAYGNARWGVICLVQAEQHLSGRRPSLEHAAIGRRTAEPEWDLLAMLD